MGAVCGSTTAYHAARPPRRIAIRGSIFQRRLDQLSFRYVEHNTRCDPEAAQIVHASGAPITLVSLDATTQARLRRDDLACQRDRVRLGYQDRYVIDGGKARIILEVLVAPAEVPEDYPAYDLLWRARFRWCL